MDTLVYYSDNPNLGKKTVTTVNGTTEYRVNCKRIKGEYHVMNKDCFLVEGTWYRRKSGLIDTDHETGEWFLIQNRKPNLVQGVVDIQNGKAVMGYFTINPYYNVQVSLKEGGTYLAFREGFLRANGYGERLSTGVWYHTSQVSQQKLNHIVNEMDHTGKGYNIEDNKAEYAEKRSLYEQFPTDVSKNTALYAKMLGDLTFGGEFECSKGYLADNLQSQLGVVVCRDGSLKDENGRPGPEFVTIPLGGAKGVQTLVNLGRELSRRTEVDLKCSYHIHLGNLDTNRLFLVSLFRLCYKIQNELFLMFPYYKANPQGIKNKNYNQKLPSLSIYSIPPDMGKREFDDYVDNSYKKIFAWLADGQVPDNIFNRKVHKHPQADKWNRSKRYFWMNAMNTIFSERNTVEFRPHTPTTNPWKIVNWLFICNAIVRFAERNYSRILMKRSGITLNEVLDYYGEQFGEKGRAVSEYLKAYVQSRKDRFVSDYEKGDKISEWEMKEDKNYKFSYGGIESLF